jgi:hypothetical protein
LHQKPDQMEETRWEAQNFSEDIAPQEEEVLELRNSAFQGRPFPFFLELVYNIKMV